MTVIQFPEQNEKVNCGYSGPEISTLTLPVASRQLHRVRFDPLEPRARAVPPAGAFNWLEENIKQGADIKGVNIEGPGDPLGEIEETLETLRLVRKRYPDTTLSITTLGIFAERYAETLTRAGVSKVTLLVDAVTREVAERLYSWIRPDKKTIPLPQAVSLLLLEQLLAVIAFRKARCSVKVRSTVYPGFNDNHLEEIARVMARAGAESMEIAPCKRTADKNDLHPEPPDLESLLLLQQRTGKHLKTTLAAGSDHFIGIDFSSPHGSCRSVSALKPTKTRPNVAVISSNGMEIDLHLGQAYQVLIYGPREDGLACLLGTRPAPEPGSSNRWEKLAATLHDCFALLAASAGESPRKVLGSHGITVMITNSEIESSVDLLYGSGKKRKNKM